MTLTPFILLFTDAYWQKYCNFAMLAICSLVSALNTPRNNDQINKALLVNWYLVGYRQRL
jgi:hypothetical protein